MTADLATSTLTSITILLVLGLTMKALAKKIKISSLFLLLLTGIFLSFLNKFGLIHLYFSDVLLVSLAIITLVMVVFEGTSSFNIKRLENFSIPSLKIVGYFIFLSLIVIAPLASLLFYDSFNFYTVLFGAVIAVIMAGTDPSAVFSMLKSKTNKVIQILELESIFNTPFTIILPLLFLEIISSSTSSSSIAISSIVFSQFKPLILEISAGIGFGILMGYFVAKYFKKFYTNTSAPITLLALSLVAYIGAELIGGSGVLSVATMGIVFGSFAIKNSDDLHTFNETLSNVFLLLVFILAGFLINTDFTLLFLLKVFLLVIVAMFVRFVALDIVLKKKNYTLREKIFLSMMMPKGVAVAVVALSLAVMTFTPGFEVIIDTTVQVILFSMVISLFFSTIVSRFSKNLLSPNNTDELKEQVVLKTMKSYNTNNKSKSTKKG